jgi:DNA-binding transcriptional ArsR family regulator
MARPTVAVNSRASHGYRLHVGELDHLPVSVALSPQHSVVGLAYHAACGRTAGSFVFGRYLRPRSRFAFDTFATPGPMSLPDCCVPIPPATDVTVAEQAERLRDMPGQVLLDDIRGPTGDHLSSTWAAASDQPRRWLRSWADTSLDAWAVLEPGWRKAGPLLDREIRRIATAAVRGGMDALLNSLHPRISYRDGFVTCAFPWHQHRELGDRRLVLVPMIAGGMLVSYELPTVAFLGYPIRGPRLPHPHSAPDDPLTLVLGPARSAALRALRRPLTVNQLAAAIGCAPTTATYHLQQLTAAGLVIREPRGPHVWISRTPRGAELVDLLST